jgi:predicted ATPase
MSDVFISYARSTAVQAQAAAEALRALGYGVWLDDELPAHRAYGDVIDEHLSAAKAVLVIWSDEAVKSDWVRSEANRAREDRKLVQARVDNTRLPMPFDQIQCADVSGWKGEVDHPGWLKVIGSAAVLVGEPRLASTPLGVALINPAASYANNLPKRLGALIGREAEMAELAALLKAGDLVTVTGTGGVGKTRIAIEVGISRLGEHEDGVWLAELAAVSDPDQVPRAVARAMNIDLPGGEDPLTALVDRLRPRHCLIILDNCEHVIDAVAGLAAAVLDTSAGVKLLASSQELLGVNGEQVFRLRSLAEPDAAALFTERARAADAGFGITDQTKSTVAAICRRLDGIPLAIEMAAARAPSLGCEGVLRRLDDRFRVLTGGRRTALPRQRTLLATLDWSHGLLSGRDAAVFRRLGIFPGDFSLDAASDVAADVGNDGFDVIDGLSSLVAKSLVAAQRVDDRTRYRLLETTRAYALEKLDAAGETAAAQRRHAEHVLMFVTPARSDYYGPVSDDGLAERYHADLDNIDRAIDWAFGPAGDPEIGIAITAASAMLWGIRSLFPEYLRWADVAVARLGAATPARIRALLLVARATACMMTTNAAVAIGVADEAVDAARALGDPIPLAEALNAKANSLITMGRAAEARPLVEESVLLMAHRPASRLTAQSHESAAYLILFEQGDAAARPFFDAVVAELRSFGADGYANWVLVIGACSLIPRDDHDVAIPALRDLLGSIRPTHMLSGLCTGNAAMRLTDHLMRRNAPGDLTEAVDVTRTHQKVAGRAMLDMYFRLIAGLLARSGRPREGARLAGFADSARAAKGIQISVALEAFEQIWADIRVELPEAELTALRAEGAKMSLDDAFRMATDVVTRANETSAVQAL